MKKPLIYTSLCVLLCLGLAGCGEKEGPPSGGTEVSVSSETAGAVAADDNPPQEIPEEEVSAQALTDDTDYDAEQELLIYIYQPAAQAYTPHRQDIPEDGVSVESIIRMVAEELEIPAPQVTAEQTKGQLILAFAADFVDDTLGDKETEQVFLNSVCASIMEAQLSVETFLLRKGGEPYKSVNRTLALEEPFQWEALRIGASTEEAFAAIRARIPYEGLDERNADFLRYDLVESNPDTVVRRLVVFLSRTGDPSRDVDAPQELDNEYLLEQAMGNVPWFTSYNYGQRQQYHPEIRPITASVADDTVVLKEHVEQAVLELFGNVTVTHQDVGHYRWHPLEGVYTPPHIGGGSVVQPVIFGYEDLGDRYVVNLTYVRNAMGVFLEESGEAITEDRLADTLANQFPRREVTVLKATDDKLIFASHHFVRSEDDEFGAAPR